jgi:YD repeat-containing protein
MIDYLYDAAGQYKSITSYNSLSATGSASAFTSNYVYDAAGQLTSLTHKDLRGGTAGLSGSEVTSYHYLYDNSGRATLSSTNHLGITQTNDYAYDNTDQVLAATYSPLPPGEGQGEGIQTDESFAYDLNGMARKRGNSATRAFTSP